MLFLNIARDFSKYPGGRFNDEGDFSAERLRDEFLVPYLESHSRITVQLDGTLGYGGSFLEECFGGLVRVHGYPARTLRTVLRLETGDAVREAQIWHYIDAADAVRYPPEWAEGGGSLLPEGTWSE